MIATKVLTSARLDSDRVKTLAKIAQKLNISKNAVIENALDLYAEAILGVTVANAINYDINSAINSAINEDRLKAVELTLSNLQANVTSLMTSTMISGMTSEIEAIKLSIARLEQPQTAVKLPNDETLTEAIKQPYSPIIELPLPTETIAETIAKATEAIDDNIFDSPYAEPTEAIEPTEDIFEQPEAIADNNQKLTLSRADFQAKFNLDDNAYSSVVNHTKAKGYTAKDGSKWFIAGSRKDRTWSNYPATLAEV